MSFLWLMTNIVLPALLIFVLVGSVFGLALGAGLVARPAPTLAWVAKMNRWVSTRRALRPLEIPRTVELRGRGAKLALGAFLAAGGAFALWFLLARLEIPQLATVLGVDIKRWLMAAVVLHTMKWFLALGSVLAVVVGVMLLAFPGALERTETALNRWYSTRQMVPRAEDLKLNLERIVERNPRAAGWIMACACGLVGLAMTILLAARR